MTTRILTTLAAFAGFQLAGIVGCILAGAIVGAILGAINRPAAS